MEGINMLVTLTPDFIANKLICPPGQRRVEYVDQGGLGLYVEVRSTNPGAGTYYLRYKNVNSKTCHQKIGTTAAISIADARKEAKRLKAEITLGADPRAAAKARKAVLTYAEFFDEHYLPHAKLHKRSWDRDEELYRLRIKEPFGGKRLNQITRHQVQSFHSSLAAEGLAAATANHHVKLLRSSLNLARQWGMLEGDNPAAGITLLHEDNKIENYLDEAQLQRLLEVLRTDRNRTVCRIALFLLSTGCRLNEALSATWADVEVERRVFTIRATNSKSRKLRSVPLNDSAIAVLSSMDRGEDGDPLFVSSRGRQRHARKAFTTIAKQWKRVREAAGLPHLRLHDLRHSFASFLVNDGRTLYEVQAILGHSTSKVTERYAHLSTKTLQEAAASASSRLTGGTPGSAR
jgi:integrase